MSAVVIRDSEGRILTVRKRGTTRFMFPGGKPDADETAPETAVREAAEELGVLLEPAQLRFVGEFVTPAANEAGHTVAASVFEHPFVDGIEAQAEIEELKWVDPSVSGPDLAPLLRDAVFPALTDRRRARLHSGYPGS